MGPEPRLGIFLHAWKWIGESTNREPDKCSAVTWFPIDELPDNLIEYPAVGIRPFVVGGESFSERGWALDRVAAAQQ